MRNFLFYALPNHTADCPITVPWRKKYPAEHRLRPLGCRPYPGKTVQGETIHLRSHRPQRLEYRQSLERRVRWYTHAPCSIGGKTEIDKRNGAGCLQPVPFLPS